MNFIMKTLKEYINEAKQQEYMLMLGVSGYHAPWETARHINGICFDIDETDELISCIGTYGNVWVYKIKSNKSKKEINDYFWNLKENYANQQSYEKNAINDICSKIINKVFISFEDILHISGKSKEKDEKILSYINKL